MFLVKKKTIDDVKTGTVMNVSKRVRDLYAIVNFDADGGEVDYTTKNYTLGKEYGELPNATKEGLAFLGWYKDGEKISEDTIVEDVGTLVATWGEAWSKYFEGSFSTTKTLAFEDFTLDKLKESVNSAYFYGSQVAYWGTCYGYHIKPSTNGVTVQYQYADGKDFKCVIVEYSEENGNVYAQIVNKCYKLNFTDASVDITTLSPTYVPNQNYWIREIRSERIS